MPREDLVQLRRDTAAQWAEVDSLLKQGEPGFEVDTGRFKIGDGVRNWTELPYQNAFLILGMEDPVPERTPSGTVIFRYSA